MPLLSRVRDLLLALAGLPVLAAVDGLLLLATAVSRLRRPRTGVVTCGGAATATIVVVARSGDAALEKCLASLAEAVRTGGPGHQVIVVGHGQADHQWPAGESPLSLLYLPGPIHDPTEGWRRGVQAATNEVVVLLRDDLVVDKDFLRPLLSCFEDPHTFAAAAAFPSPSGGDGHVETLQCNVSTAPVDLEWSPLTGRTRGELRHGEIRLWEGPSPEGEATVEPVLWAPRGRSAFRRSMLLSLGGPDPLFADPVLGDADLCFRAWKQGWRVLLEPRSIARRALSGRPEAVPPDLVERDRILFAWKNLASAGDLVRHTLSLTARLLSDASAGRLNLRPLRHALGCLPAAFARRAAPSPPSRLTDEEVFRLSSHRYFLQRQEEMRERGGAEMRGATLTPTPSQGERGWTGRRDAGAPGLSTRLRLLLVCPQLPYPPTHGAAVRMWNLLKQLGSRHRVDLLSFSEPGLGPEEVHASVAELQHHCDLVRTVPRRPFPARPSPLDRTIHVEMFDCPEMREALLEMVDRRDYDLIQFDKTEMGQYVLPPPAPPQLLIEHIVFYRAFRRQFLRVGRGMAGPLFDYLRLRRYELGVCRRFDGITAMSRVDAEYLRSRLPSHPCIAEVPNGVDTGYYQYAPNPAEGHDLLFIGAFDHSPNVDGVRFFLREVFPKVKASVPDVRLLIVGPGPYGTVPEVAAEPRVIATGLVPDTRPYMVRCSVLVAPILAGSGTRLKILEAMSAGLPVVSTTIGAEGLDAAPGVHLLVADEPGSFARAVLRLLESRQLRQSLRASARHLVDARYDWSSVAQRLEDVYAAVLR